MKIIKEKKDNNIDIRDLYIKLMEENRNVFIHQIDESIYMFRSIKRSEYKKIFSDDSFTDMQKEDIVCETCVLYPVDKNTGCFNADECDAGIPTQLSSLILKYSYMDSLDTQSKVMYAYRNEMNQLSKQIDCIITEAFPQKDLEEIENWDMDQTLKYLSRAEWLLVNLRGLKIDPDYFNFKAVAVDDGSNANTEPKTQEITDETVEHPVKKNKKQKLTPEKLAQLKKDMPEIDWENDSVMKEGINALHVREGAAALLPDS